MFEFFIFILFLGAVVAVQGVLMGIAIVFHAEFFMPFIGSSLLLLMATYSLHLARVSSGVQRFSSLIKSVGWYTITVPFFWQDNPIMPFWGWFLAGQGIVIASNIIDDVANR